MASADFGYCVFILQIRNSRTYLSGLSQNNISRSLSYVNWAADWRFVMRNFVLFALALQIVSV